MSDPALRILRTVFGYDAFRGAQAEIVAHVAGGSDALVLMPTGGGKSLCYQLPSLLREGCGIVVSPLIALMRDQVAGLIEAGVNAAVLNSTLSPQEANEVERRLIAGDLDLLYVAPERLLGPGVAADEEAAIALLWKALDGLRGKTLVFLAPCAASTLVRTAYGWGARNVELHVAQSTAPVAGPWCTARLASTSRARPITPCGRPASRAT